MRTLWKFCLSFIAVPLVIAGVFYTLNKNGYFNLSRIEILIENTTHSKLALKRKVETLQIDLSLHKGQSLWDLKLKDFSTRIQQESWIESFHITRIWPSGIRVQVTASPAYFVYLNKHGEFYPVMGNGEMLDPVGAGEIPDVPLVQDTDFQKSRDLRLKLIAILKDIPVRGSFSRAQISEIHYDKKSGFSFTLVREGLIVKIGEDQVRKKSLRVSEVLDYLEAKKFQARVIDANLSQKVLVRLRKEP